MPQKKIGKTKSPAKKTTAAPESIAQQLFNDIRLLIDQTRNHVAQTVNSSLVLLNWHIGQRIRKEVLGDERAEYGKQVLQTLAKRLTYEFGKGFTKDALLRMAQFVERFPDAEI